MGKVKVAVLSATGIVGQAIVWMLSGHKYFEPVYLSASTESKGKRYGDEVNRVLPYDMPSDTAKNEEIELREAENYVFSNAGADSDNKVDSYDTAIVYEVNPNCDPQKLLEIYPDLNAVLIIFNDNIWYKGDFELSFD